MSVYPLTIEPHNIAYDGPFDAAVLAGDMEEPDDDVEAAHMQMAARVLDSEGFERYEVASAPAPASSAATTRRTGRACRKDLGSNHPFGRHDDAERASVACGSRRPGDRRL